MPLDQRSVVDFLLDRGAFAPGDVLDGDLVVEDVSRRNTNFAVRLGAGSGLFVKQAPEGAPLNLASLHQEAVVARAAARDPAFAPVRDLAPRFVLFDAEQAVLVVRLVEGAEDLQARARREGGVAPHVARALGAAVGRMHAEGPTDPATGAAEQHAWILHLPDLADEGMPPGRPHQELREVARRDDALREGLAALRDGWRRGAFIHGDLKWDNVVVAERDGATAITLVDWEMGGAGDPSWDAGGLLHAYLREWIALMPGDAVARGDATGHLGTLTAMWPSIAALWEGYAAAAPEPDLGRSVRFAAARVLQTAFESVVGQPAFTPHAAGLAQLAANVMARPDEAARVLFGLETGV